MHITMNFIPSIMKLTSSAIHRSHKSLLPTPVYMAQCIISIAKLLSNPTILVIISQFESSERNRDQIEDVIALNMSCPNIRILSPTDLTLLALPRVFFFEGNYTLPASTFCPRATNLTPSLITSHPLPYFIFI